MFQFVKAAVAGLVLVEAGAAAGGESVSAWDVATGVDGHFPTLNKRAHTAVLSQGSKRTHHAKVHHHKKVAVHRRQHRRAGKRATKHQAKHVHLRSKKGHGHTAHKRLVNRGRHHTTTTTTAAQVEAADDNDVADSTSEETVAASSLAAPASVVAVAPAVHVAVQTKQQLASKSQTRSSVDDEEDKKGSETDNEDVQKVRYGPNECVSTWRNSVGHCMMQTDCKEEDVQRYEFSLVCVDQGGGEIRHIFGEDSFDTQETFDTLLNCKECQGWPRPTATTTAEPVQLHAKAGDDVVKKAEDAASKVELSTAQAVEQLVGQVKELKEQLTVAAKEVDALNERVGITGKKEEAAADLSQNAAPSTSAPLTVILDARPKTAILKGTDAEAHAPKRSLRAKAAKHSTQLKQQATDDEDAAAEDSEQSTEAVESSDSGASDVSASDDKSQTSRADASDDASEGEEVD